MSMDGKNPNCAYGNWDCMPCTNCDAYIPTKTNADHIRSMSDEELARFLAEVENRRSAAGGGAIWKGAAHAKEWLKQPYKEDT